MCAVERAEREGRIVEERDDERVERREFEGRIFCRAVLGEGGVDDRRDGLSVWGELNLRVNTKRAHSRTHLIDVSFQVQQDRLDQLETIDGVMVPKVIVGQRGDEDLKRHPRVVWVLDETFGAEKEEIAQARKHL